MHKYNTTMNNLPTELNAGIVANVDDCRTAQQKCTALAKASKGHCDEHHVWTIAARKLHRSAVKLWIPYRDDHTQPDMSLWSDSVILGGGFGESSGVMHAHLRPQLARTLTREEFKLKCVLATRRSQHLDAFRLLGDWVRNYGWAELASRRKRITHVEFLFHVNKRGGGYDWFVVVLVDRHDRVRVFFQSSETAWWHRIPINDDRSCYNYVQAIIHKSLMTFSQAPNLHTTHVRLYDAVPVDGVPKRVLTKHVWPS